MERAEKIVDATIFVGVYGSIRSYSWITPELLEEDVYSMFMARAEAMGWSFSGPDRWSAGLWGMNEAGQNWSPPSSSNLIAWVQTVALENQQFPGVRPLPVQPIVACIKDSVGRFGDLALTGIQLLLPVQLGGAALGHLVSGLNWFNACDPAARVRIRVTLDGGQDDSVRHKGADTLAALQRFNTGAFTFDSVSSDKARAVQLEPNVVGDLWLGQGRHPVTLEGTAPERSFDAWGWVVGICAEACREVGVQTNVLISVS